MRLPLSNLPQPAAAYFAAFKSGNISCEADPAKAVAEAQVLYTDVWVSTGMEEESQKRMGELAPWQINAALVAKAAPSALDALPACLRGTGNQAALPALSWLARGPQATASEGRLFE